MHTVDCVCLVSLLGSRPWRVSSSGGRLVKTQTPVEGQPVQCAVIPLDRRQVTIWQFGGPCWPFRTSVVLSSGRCFDLAKITEAAIDPAAMPFGEVMYRCNAHYCFSVFRNRVVGLLTTLALMQLFLFSFYLNGLHSETVVSRNDVNFLVDEASISKLPPSGAEVRQPPVIGAGARGQAQPPGRALPEEEPEIRVDQASSAAASAAASAKGQGQVQMTGLASLAVPNNLVNHLTDLLTDRTKSKAVGEAAKKALDSVLAANKSDLTPMQLMAMAAGAAKKMAPSGDQPADVTKIGFNLLANAFNNINKPKSPESSLLAAAMDAMSRGPQPANGDAADKDADAKKYADLAKMGLQLFSSGLLNNDQSPSAKSPAVNALLETAAQLVLQQDSAKAKSPLDAAMTKTAIGMLSNALANQKMDPKMMLNMASMAAKVLQSPSQQSAPSGSDLMASLNLLSKLVPNGRPSAPSASSAANVNQGRWNQSDDIYSDYVRYTVKTFNLAGVKSNSALPHKAPSAKSALVDIDFNFWQPEEEMDICQSSTDYVVLVVSAVDNYERRQAARRTWIDQLQHSSGRVKTLFVVGQSGQQSIQREWRQYGDVIQVLVPDSARGAALKTAAGLLWIQQNCPQVKQILKCEDDVFVNVPKMLHIIESQQDESVLLGTRVIDGNPHNSHGNQLRIRLPCGILTQFSSVADLRHAVEGKVWPWNKYPPFLLGGAYLIGKQAIPRLLNAVQVTPVLPVEDVYITGLCALGGHVDSIHHER